ncbi:hypothetical protein QY702_04615 [Xanthomonas campestris pv. plantaginis]|uniref:hypothetical protein n=1 Tax=Xanthomonas campestris TaxID=339 RepID=UPI002B222C39|nr:hypothetical protein [Xanthomonas campestris]MEA9605751.1 hypothetical protein [Xanthomonas campestris pv. plantaginis]
MTIEFCPLADEVGNLADWAAVVVGALAAIATTVVAVLAYKTSNRATDIAGEAKVIAEQQHRDLLDQKQGTARILGSLLQMEVGLLPTKLTQLLHDYDDKLKAFEAREYGSGADLESVIGDLGGAFLPAAEGVLDRLHTLPDQLGALIASVIGMARDLRDTRQLVIERFDRINGMQGGFIVVGYKRDLQDFSNLRGQIRTMLRQSIKLAESFNAFTNAVVVTYEEERAAADLDG